MNLWSQYVWTDFTLRSSLSRAVKWLKNAIVTGTLIVDMVLV